MARHGRTLGLVAALLVPVAFATGCAKKEPPPPPEPAPPPPPPPKVYVPITRAAEARDGSTVVVAKLRERTIAYISDEDDSAVRAFDVATRTELSRTPLDGRPGQMLVDKAGRLLVALRTDQAVAVLEATADERAPLDATATIETAGAEPIAMALTPDESTLLVTTGWGHSLEAYELASATRRFAVDVAREPRAVTVASDGKTAYVAHAAAGHLSAVDLEEASRTVAPIDLGVPGWTERRGGAGLQLFFKLDGDGLDEGAAPRHRFVCGTGLLHHEVTFPARVARQGFSLARVHVKPSKAKQGSAELEERVLAPHAAVATGDAKVRSTGYGGGGLEEAENIPTEMFDIDVIDAAKRARATGHHARVAPRFRSGAQACRLPRAAAVDDARQRLYVSCLGVDKVMEYDASGSTPAGGFLRAIDVGAGPTGIALDLGSRQAVVWSAFDRVVNVFSIAEPIAEPAGEGAAKKKPAKAAPPPPPEVTRVAVAPPSTPLAPEAALGERLFHRAGNTKISKDGRACASCHPDGRDDGLVWSTPDGPRQTILLAGRVERASPFGWLGKHGSLEEHITITMKNLKGTGASAEELGALASWLRAMKAPPRAKQATIGPKEERGRELFNSSALQCGTCHAEKDGFSDHESHDVASATGADVSRQFLVPSLRFVGGSSPYFHDGRYATLGELLEKNDKMGDTKSLSREDRDALEAYLRAL
ncbi:MAG: hypothetical protein KF782_05005 [Labilithrix sp.]|nr:hypothetical protein [Labilithrix sp.]